jgi:uncharacterized protein YcgI (DUF1989 family)
LAGTIVVGDGGRTQLISDHCPAGASIDLRTEMDVLFILANCPHPLAPAGDYLRARVRIEIFQCDPPGPDDFCRNLRPECGRTLALTERLYL